ncbi:MAG: DMT family transporter [Candidatus Paceibacterota bacterium]|jgi:drug/metabolite transporter (DMT)-like permease
MGVFFAFIALFSWGIGDFLIQRSTRAFGNYVAIFYITAFGSVVFFPFAYRSIPSLLSFGSDFMLLMFTSVVILFASLLDLQALKMGKISVVEPIFALEIPVTALLASFVIGESISVLQASLIIIILFGIILVSTKRSDDLKIRIEKGVMYAIFATFLMGSVDFLFGVSSREMDPFLVNWFTSVLLAFFTLFYLILRSRTNELVRCWKTEKKLIFGIGFFDNLAWISYSYSMLYVPIAIATSISQSYLVIVASLGIILNKEKLKRHQYLGLAVTISGAIVLAYITGE